MRNHFATQRKPLNVVIHDGYGGSKRDTEFEQGNCTEIFQTIPAALYSDLGNSTWPLLGSTLEKDYVDVHVFGDIGFSIEIVIDGSRFELWQYDRSVNDAMKTNEQNIIYQLEVLRDFLNEKPK